MEESKVVETNDVGAANAEALKRHEDRIASWKACADTYGTEAEAHAAGELFIARVKDLREELRIANVVLMIAVPFGTTKDSGSEQTATAHAAAMGHPDTIVDLAAHLYTHYAEPVIRKARETLARVSGAINAAPRETGVKG